MPTEDIIESKDVEFVTPPEPVADPEAEHAVGDKETPTEIEETAPIESEEPKEPEDESGKTLDELPLPEVTTENKKELPKWMEKKLSKRDREVAAKEAEIASLREQMARLANGNTAQPVNAPGVVPPKRDDFQSEDDYIDARFEYKQRMDYIKHQTATQQQAAMNAEAAFINKMKQAQDAGSDSYDDYDDVVRPLFSPGFPSNRAMAEAIVDSPYNHDILYFLGKYPDKAREIAQLNPVQAIKKIGEIEMRFQSRKAQAQPSKAPAPMDRIKTNNASPLLDIDKIAKTGSQRDFEAAISKITSQRKNAWS